MLKMVSSEQLTTSQDSPHMSIASRNNATKAMLYWSTIDYNLNLYNLWLLRWGFVMELKQYLENSLSLVCPQRNSNVFYASSLTQCTLCSPSVTNTHANIK